jgi:hypothetical protein
VLAILVILLNTDQLLFRHQEPGRGNKKRQGLCCHCLLPTLFDFSLTLLPKLSPANPCGGHQTIAEKKHGSGVGVFFNLLIRHSSFS